MDALDELLAHTAAVPVTEGCGLKGSVGVVVSDLELGEGGGEVWRRAADHGEGAIVLIGVGALVIDKPDPVAGFTRAEV